MFVDIFWETHSHVSGFVPIQATVGLITICAIKVLEELLKKCFFMSYRLSMVILTKKASFESSFESPEDPEEYSMKVLEGLLKKGFLCRIDYQW